MHLHEDEIKILWQQLGNDVLQAMQSFYEEVEELCPKINAEELDQALVDTIHSVVDYIQKTRDPKKYYTDRGVNLFELIMSWEDETNQ